MGHKHPASIAFLYLHWALQSTFTPLSYGYDGDTLLLMVKQVADCPAFLEKKVQKKVE